MKLNKKQAQKTMNPFGVLKNRTQEMDNCGVRLAGEAMFTFHFIYFNVSHVIYYFPL